MGSERTCAAELNGRRAEGDAKLETDVVIFSGGGVKFKWAFRDLKKVTVDGDVLVLTSREGIARLALGSHAPVWAKKIASPPTLMDKLGIGAASDVAIVVGHGGWLPRDFLAELEARAHSVKTTPGAIANADVVLFAAETTRALDRVVAIALKLRDDGALWVVYPKGVTAIRERDVLGKGREAKLKDVKVARFSETHTALKFVIPRERRASKSLTSARASSKATTKSTEK